MKNFKDKYLILAVVLFIVVAVLLSLIVVKFNRIWIESQQVAEFGNCEPDDNAGTISFNDALHRIVVMDRNGRIFVPDQIMGEEDQPAYDHEKDYRICFRERVSISIIVTARRNMPEGNNTQ